MEKKLMELLEEKRQTINEDKATVMFNEHSIDVIGIDEEGYEGIGEKYYNAYDAYDRLEFLGALEEGN